VIRRPIIIRMGRVSLLLFALLGAPAGAGRAPLATGSQDISCMRGASAGCASAAGLQEFMLWWMPVGALHVADDASSGFGVAEASGSFLLYSPLHGSKHGKVRARAEAWVGRRAIAD